MFKQGSFSVRSGFAATTALAPLPGLLSTLPLRGGPAGHVREPGVLTA